MTAKKGFKIEKFGILGIAIGFFGVMLIMKNFNGSDYSRNGKLEVCGVLLTYSRMLFMEDELSDFI